MEGFTWLAQFLLETASKLLLRNNDPGTKQRLGDLLIEISGCIEEIAVSVQRKERPSQRCTELATYLRGIEPIAERAVDKEFAKSIMFWLEHVEAVPGVAKIDLESTIQRESKPRWTEAERYRQAEELKNVAAMIKATGNLVRV